MNEKEFISEIQKFGIDITDKQLNQLDKYFELLVEWNQKINLTAITEKPQVYLKHFYDSLTLSLAADLNNIDSLCDVGTGAGFPGIVIKILFPHINITLIDALNKRINFLNDIIKKLNLDSIVAIHSRSEDYAKDNREKFDIVTARAVAALPILLEICVPLVKVGGCFIPMKGHVNSEIEESKTAIKKLNLEQLDSISLDLVYGGGKRTLLKFKKIKETEKQYPRAIYIIKNKPLK